uniref:Uncharacterized protein n=1 Tax=Glossina pallidipes TaxID=7398 RepID=A0A1A9ZXT7_GLOPL
MLLHKRLNENSNSRLLKRLADGLKYNRVCLRGKCYAHNHSARFRFAKKDFESMFSNYRSQQKTIAAVGFCDTNTCVWLVNSGDLEIKLLKCFQMTSRPLCTISQ